MSAAPALRRYLGALRDLRRDGAPAAAVLAALTDHLSATLGCPDVALDVALDDAASSPLPQVPVPPMPRALAAPALLGQAHEAVLDETTRRTTGAHYTPPVVAERLVGFALDQRETPLERVCDPAVGGGAFLLAAAEAITARYGTSRAGAARCCWGIDLDPLAVAVTRASLRLWAGEPLPELDAQVVVADALLEPADWQRRFDLVVGNPPFLNQLETATARDRHHATRLRTRYGDAAAGYVDTAALFLLRGLELVRDRGQVVLIQPHSTLATRGAAALRDELLARARLTGVWFAAEPVFRAGVRVWAPVLTVPGPQPAEVLVDRRSGAGVSDAQPVGIARSRLATAWSPLVADLAGVPPVRRPPDGAGRAGDLATATAGFRRQFYGLAEAVTEAAAARSSASASSSARSGALGTQQNATDAFDRMPRLVTVGLIDVLACRWGERPTRLAGVRYDRPVVDLGRLSEDLQPWVRAQLRPKLLVATQTKVLEVAVDEDGGLVPSTPVIAVHADADRLWHLAAALSAPPVTVHALHLALGTALLPSALKLSAKQVLALPLPVDAAAWDDGAALARDLARARTAAPGPGAVDPAILRKAFVAFGVAMCAAYRVDPDEVLEWWLTRIN